MTDRRPSAALCLLLLAGCAFEPEGAEPMAPLPGYAALWDSAEACSGRTGRLDRVRFWMVPGHSFMYDGKPTAAYTYGQDIYIAADWIEHPMIVKHEMIHALGVHGHPYHPFVDPCRATWESWPGGPPRITELRLHI